jgi:peptidase E
MSNRQPFYLLAGGRGSDNLGVFRTVFKAIGKAEPVIAYVGAANGDDRFFFGFMGAEVKKMGPCKLERVLLASKKADVAKAKEILSAADAVFMSGGDVEAGMQIVEDKGMADFFRSLMEQGKLFFGASAGSIMMADQWVRWRDPEDDSTAELFTCLGLAPVICDTHAEEDDWVELKAALQLKGSGAMGYGIPSGACLAISPDRGLSALGRAVAVYSNKSGKIVKESDLIPRK